VTNLLSSLIYRKYSLFYKIFGSQNITSLGFRDSWAFIGAKPGMGRIANERMKRVADSPDDYLGWPGEVTIEGCIPKF
jgi:hypothetical protein